MLKFNLAVLALVAFAVSLASAEPVPPPELKEAQITLPYSELKELWRAAQREPQEKRKPPVETSLLSARYQLALKGDQAAGVVDYEVESFTDDWAVVSLLGAQSQIDEVEPADVQLITRDGHYAVVTNRPGKLKLRIKFAVKLNPSADGAHFRLTTSPAAINTLAVAGLAERQTLRIAEAIQLSAEKDRASFRLPARDQLDFDIVPEKAIVPPSPSHWKLDTQALVQSTEGKLNYVGRLLANTDNGSGLGLDLEFPAGAEITRIAGPDLADWQANTAEQQTRRIHLRWQTRDLLRREIEVEYNFPQSLTGGEWNLRAPHVVDGENNPPLFVVVPEPGLELSSTDQPAAPRQLPAWILEKTDGKNYALFVGEAPVTAKWLPLVETAQAVVETASAKTRIVADGALLSEIGYTIRHDRALRWTLSLPEGSDLVSASIEGAPVKPIDRGDRILEFALPSGKGISAISISYTAKKPAFKPVSGQIAVELPQTDLLVHWIDWELRIPAIYEIAAFEGNVESVPGDKTENGSRALQFHKELCQKERPRAEFFYQKPQPNK